jgi:hypothetical protein
MMSCQYAVTSGLCMRPLALYQRSKLTQTASALKSVPSWNFTPDRSLNVQVVPAASGSQDSARPGLTLVPPSSGRTRVSNTWRATRNDSPSLAKLGSSTFGSPATPKTRVSLLLPPEPSRSLSAQPATARAAAATAAIATFGLDARMVLHLVLGGTDNVVTGSPMAVTLAPVRTARKRRGKLLVSDRVLRDRPPSRERTGGRTNPLNSPL